MSALETLIEPLRHSPRLPEVVDALQRQIAEERERRHRFYDEMTPEQKIEFIDGQVVMHSPARNQHLDATVALLRLLSSHVDLHRLGTVKSEKCLCTFPRNDYEPDIVFFGTEKAATLEPGTMRFPPPDLVVEVLSASTEKNDRGVKFEDYAANGVGEYWIIDAEGQVVEQYSLVEGDYELKFKAPSGTVKSQVIGGLEVAVESIFDHEKNLAALKSVLAG